MGPDHAYYDADSTHITIRSNENFRGSPAADDPDVIGCGKALKEALSDIGPCTIRFRGIIGVPSSLLLCGYPEFDLAELRQSYFRLLKERGLIRPGPEQSVDKVRNTCHASLVIFSGPLKEPGAVHDRLQALSDMDFGTVPDIDWDIVAYERTRQIVRAVSLVKEARTGVAT